jgi:oligoendopeptidase F
VTRRSPSIARDPAMTALTLQGAQERARADVPEEHRWNLADLYPTVEAWRAAKDRLAAEVPRLAAFKGRLESSAAVLADALDLQHALDKELSRASAYASLLADEDTRDSSHESMRQEMVQLWAAFHAEGAYLRPEILRFAPGRIAEFLAAEPRLAVYRFPLEDLVRLAPHTLSPAEEKLLADAGPIAGASGMVYTTFTNADFPYPTIRLVDGTEARINQAGYNVHRASAIRADREQAMSAFFEAYAAFSRTLGTTMNGSVRKALFYAKARQYSSALEAALSGPNIPLAVYTRLVDGVNRHLPSFHRYLRLRQRMLGVSELHYYDLYAPLVGSVKLTYTPEEAERHVLAAMAPLGADYLAALRRAFDERWIDLFPTPGKRSGAYSQGAVYDVHPFVLMNYNGKYDDMGTLAHELGHSMHSYFSNKAQPYPTADYPIFLAEVASTFNESLLIDYMLKAITDDAARLALLGNYLEGIKGTVFRQTQFAEFELRMHEMVARGQPLTGEKLAALYLDLTKRYYGHDQQVTVVDDYIAHEWSFIPHFYREFYVYQYATSHMASEALAQKVKAGDAGATTRYLTLIASGGSAYPIDLLRAAGVDMTTDEPLELTMREMNRVMDEMERLLAKEARPPA